MGSEMCIRDRSVDVIFLYDVINKIGALADRAEQVGHRISLIASR